MIKYNGDTVPSLILYIILFYYIISYFQSRLNIVFVFDSQIKAFWAQLADCK